MFIYDLCRQFLQRCLQTQTPPAAPDNQNPFEKALKNDPSLEAIEKLVRSVQPLQVQLVVDQLDSRLRELSFSDPLYEPCCQALSSACRVWSVLPKTLVVKKSLKTVGQHPVTGDSFLDIWKGELDRHKVAIKMIRVFYTGVEREAFMGMFFNEVLLWRNLKHENILPFLGVNTTLFPLSIVSPWTAEVNIVEYLDNNKHADREKLLIGITDGLNYLHTRKPVVVHGDLRGENILIDSATGRPLIQNYGLAQCVKTIQQPTLNNIISDSLRWMSPEMQQASPYDRLTTENDIYAFGCLCYEVYTLKMPFWGIKGTAAIMRITAGQTPLRPSESELSCPLPDTIWALMERCWTLDPQRRPSAKECLTCLQDNIGTRS